MDEKNPDVPSLHKGPRESDALEHTGTGTPRSADDGLQEPGALGDRDAPASDAVVTGATTSSQPASADELTINRSGSGGSGEGEEAER